MFKSNNSIKLDTRAAEPPNDHQATHDPDLVSSLTVSSTALAINALDLDNPNSPEHQRKLELEAEMAKRARSMKQHKKWIRRFKVLFCCLGFKKNKDSIADVASIFAEFFGDLDVPSSDLAAGFVLLSKYQSAQREWVVKNRHNQIEQYLSHVPIREDTNFLDISTAKDSHLINDLIYYMNYSLAIFGWPMQLFEDPCMVCCICPYLKISPCCSRGTGARKRAPTKSSEPDTKTPDGNKEFVEKVDCKQTDDNNNQDDLRDKTPVEVEEPVDNRIPGQLDEDCDRPIILNDNCCGCNVASVERRLAAHNYEIIYFSYKVNINVVPFLVAADHSKRTIVIAMRGSMSLSDMVTDMNGQTDKLPIENCPDDWLCHRGITSAANYVKKALEEGHILDRAFNCRPDLGSQDYTLVLCGHSLGAGVAAILGILMRAQYPTLRACLYSPPGGLLSLPAVEYSKEFATGIILGSDCVPRLGVAQLERLRYHVLLSLKSSDKSSGKILAKALCPSSCLGTNKVDYNPDESLNLLHGTEGRSFDYNGVKIPFQVQPQVLYVPGKLIHIVKNHSFKPKGARRFFNDPIYQAVWNDNTAYDRVLISEGMFTDHLPNKLMHAMKMLFCNTLPGRRELSRASFSSVPLEVGETISEKTHVSAPTVGSDPPGGLEGSEPAERGKIVIKEDSEEARLDSIKSEDRTDLDRIKPIKTIDDNNNNNEDDEPTIVNYPNLAAINGKEILDSNGNDATTININIM